MITVKSGEANSGGDSQQVLPSDLQLDREIIRLWLAAEDLSRFFWASWIVRSLFPVGLSVLLHFPKSG